MVCRPRFRWSFGCAILVFLCLGSAGLSRAQDPPPVPPTPPSAVPAPAEEPDPFVVPEGTPEQVLEYIEKLGKMRPPARDQRTVITFIRKSSTAMVKAADKVLASAEATKEQKATAAGAKFRGLHQQAQFGAPEALEGFKGMPAQLTELGLVNLARTATGDVLRLEMLGAIRGRPDSRPVAEIIEAIQKHVTEHPDAESLGVGASAAMMLARFGKGDEATALCESLIEPVKQHLATDPGPNGYSVAFQLVTLLNRPGTKDKAEALCDDLLKLIKKHVAAHPDMSSSRLAMQAIMMLDQLGNADEAGALCDEFVEVFSKSDDPDLAKLVKQLTGIGRRVRLLGNTMELKGKTLDGKEFDWSKYRGKIVLVDFWATWCGPCVGEIPNVLKQYKLYHDRGFDVVGISLARSAEALKKFV